MLFRSNLQLVKKILKKLLQLHKLVGYKTLIQLGAISMLMEQKQLVGYKALLQDYGITWMLTESWNLVNGFKMLVLGTT